MNGFFDRQWQSRLAGGEAEAALQLADGLFEPLYAYCCQRLGERDASQRVVRSVLIRAVREIDSYDPSRYDDAVFQWVLGFADRAIQATGHRLAADDEPETPPPESTFLAKLQTALCLEARERRHLEKSGRYRHRKSVAVACPSCGAKSRISPTRLSQQTRCGRCGETVLTESAQNVTKRARSAFGTHGLCPRCAAVTADGRLSRVTR